MQIEFECVSVEGYGPFRKRVDYTLSDRGAVLLKGENRDDPGSDSNGAGKTSLLMAPLWILTGETDPRPVGTSTRGLKSEVVNEYESKAWGQLQLTVDGVKIGIEREMGKAHKLRCMVDGVDRTEQDVKGTQAVIDAIVPTGLLRYVIFFSQHDVDSLLDLTDKSRKELLGKVIDLEIWDQASKLASKRSTEADKDVVQVTGMIEGQRLSAEKATEGLERAKKDHANWQDDHAKKLTAMSAKPFVIGIASFDVSNLTAMDIEHLTKWVAGGNAAVYPHDSGSELGDLRLQAKELEHKIQHHVGQLDKLGEDGKRIKEHGKSLAHSRGVWTCSECKQPVQLTNEQLQKRLDDALKDLNSVRHSWRESKRMLGECRTQLEAVNGKIEVTQVDSEESKTKYLEGLQAAKRLALDARSLLEKARSYKEWSDKKSPFLVSIKAFEEMAQEMGDQGELQERMDAAKEASISNRALSVSFGRAGIQSYIMDGAIGDLGERVSRYLDDLSGGYLKLAVKGQTETQAGAVREKISFDFGLRRQDGSYSTRTYRQLSGGQQRRCKVVMAMAFADFVMDRTGITTNLIVLDEVLGSVDAEGKTKARDMILQLQRDSVFVISHDADLGGQFDSVDLVVLEGDESTVQGVM